MSNPMRSISGKLLPPDWPKIASDDEVAHTYAILKSKSEDPNKSPTSKTHIEHLSYELKNGNKRLRFFAVKHLLDTEDINRRQFEILERKFKTSPPQLVLIEGQTDFDYSFTRGEALKHGEQTFMCYLVQQYNNQLKARERPIVIESGDALVNTEPDDEVRDKEIIMRASEKFRIFDRIDMVFGSGHAIRQRKVWEEFFD